MSDTFESDFCHVQYLKKDHVVLLRWKSACHHDDYRQPTSYALERLQEHEGSSFVIDARDSFEDHKDDVDWAFTELLPAMSKTECKNVIFIMNPVNLIEDEMDMWTREFSKYFTCRRVSTYAEALKHLDNGRD